MRIKFNKKIYNQEFLKDDYTKHAPKENIIEGIPYVNFPFEIILKEEYKYLSWFFIDYDSNTELNFSWIHWLVANYEVENNNYKVPERLVETNSKYIGGTNSFAGINTNVKDEKVILNYGGPIPSNNNHIYDLVVYAHDKKMNLEKGFHFNEFLNELDKIDHRIAKGKILSRR